MDGMDSFLLAPPLAAGPTLRRGWREENDWCSLIEVWRRLETRSLLSRSGGLGLGRGGGGEEREKNGEWKICESWACWVKKTWA